MFLGIESKYIAPLAFLGGGAALIWYMYTSTGEWPTSVSADASDALPLGDAEHYLREAKSAGYTSAELHFGRGNCSGTNGPHVSIPKPGSVFKKICFACGDTL